MGDSFARGFDIFRLQANLQARSFMLMVKVLTAIGVMGVSGYTYWAVPEHILLGAGRYALAYLLTGIVGVDLQSIPVFTDSGWQAWPTDRIVRDRWHVAAWNSALSTVGAAFLVFLALSGPLAVMIFYAARKRGRTATADMLARGQRVVDDGELDRIVRQTTRVSRFKVGRVGIPETVLNRAFVALGTPGTGKSVLIKRWMREIEKRGDIAIVFDKVGDFTAEFHNAERGDVLLNPLDSRSPPWSPWSEMRQISDAYRIAKSLIPSAQGDNNFFHIAAQDLFATLLTRVWTLKDRSLQGLLEAALVWQKEDKAALLYGTSAAKHYLGEHRSGHDVDATMSVYTQALRFLPASSGRAADFSIRDFITDTVTRMETKPRDALANLETRLAADHNAALEARRLLSIGDLRRAREHVGRAAQRFPLLPDGMTVPVNPAAFASWWASERADIEAHWAAQDAALPDMRRALQARHEDARRRLSAGAPWLFIASDQRQLAAVRPLLSLWLDAVADTIMSLPPSNERRIWFILDELQALQELPSLQPLLTEGRKYGACVVAGVQNMGQLRTNYGADRAEVLLSLLNTKAFFRLPEPRTAKWCEDAIGSAVMERMGESIRYGTSETMDGAQLSPHRSTEPIVMAGDIARQPDLHCYLTLPGNWPVGRIQLAFNAKRDAPKPRTKALVPRPQNETIFAALDRKGWTPKPEGDDPIAMATVARTLADSEVETDDKTPASKPARPKKTDASTPSAAPPHSEKPAKTPPHGSPAQPSTRPATAQKPPSRPTPSAQPDLAAPAQRDLLDAAKPRRPRRSDGAA
jgi:hypothetical protein